MSRETSEDFNNLSKFIKEYNLTALASNLDFTTVLSQQHKKYFSYLTCLAELVISTKKSSLQPNISLKQMSFISESCSDIGSSLFVMTHGAYKASKMMLRSSIETFLKGYNLDEIHDIDQEKSVYAIFDKIKVLTRFTSEPYKSIFDSLRHTYKLLCLDTHTASELNMQQITALKYFPNFNLDEAKKISEISMLLSSSYNTLLCLKYNAHFQQMHHRNKENIIESIPKEYRPLLHGIR